MDNERIIDKIRKLLAKSSSSFSNEAEASILKAQELLAKHKLTMADLEGQNDRRQVKEEIVAEFQKRPWYAGILSAIIADNFRCYSVYFKKNRSSRLCFIGQEEDTAIAREVYMFAFDAITNKAQAIRSGQDRASGFAQANDYIKGFLDGLSRKFNEQVERNQWGLILVKDNEVTELYESYRPKAAKPVRIRRSDNNNIYSAGYRDGYNFQHKSDKLQIGDGNAATH
ncbi:MAG: hypothetical protein H6Q73_27 [Firmicutes bacterium]|nr:hypothetical protein [Bacillota bacterium]